MKSFGAIAIVVVVVTVASLNSLHDGLLLDDWDIVERNPHFGSPRQWLGIFVPSKRPARLATYRPIRELTFAVDQAISGKSVARRHLSSLIVYIGTILMLWVVARRVGLATSTTFVVTCWFALHAAHSEALCWLKNRGELLATLFGLGCVASCLAPGRMMTSAAVICLLLAMGSMEAAVAFAGVALAGGILATKGERSVRLRTGLVLAIVAVAYAVIQKCVLGQTDGRPNAPTLGFIRNPAIVLELVGRYCYMLLAPHNLCMDVGAGGGLTFGQASAIAALGVVVLTVVRRGRRVYACALLLLPLGLLSVIFIFDRPVAEHRIFSASAGLALCMGSIAQSPKPSRLSRTRLGLLLLGTCALAALFVHRNFLWRDELSVWRDDVVKSPSLPKARMNFAGACLRSGLTRRAERSLMSGIRASPTDRRWLNPSLSGDALRKALARVREIQRKTER